MNADDRKSLADLALLTANDKSRTMDVVRALLNAAEEQCRSFRSCHSTFEGDPEIAKLAKDIMELQMKIPRYEPNVMEVVAGIKGGDYDYYNGNDIFRLRRKDLEARGTKFKNEDEWELDVPWEDPLDVYKRLREG
jgi:hypothetical protein